VPSRCSLVGGGGGGCGGVDGRGTAIAGRVQRPISSVIATEADFAYVPNTCVPKCRRTFACFNNFSRDVSKRLCRPILTAL